MNHPERATFIWQFLAKCFHGARILPICTSARTSRPSSAICRRRRRRHHVSSRSSPSTSSGQPAVPVEVTVNVVDAANPGGTVVRTHGPPGASSGTARNRSSSAKRPAEAVASSGTRVTSSDGAAQCGCLIGRGGAMQCGSFLGEFAVVVASLGRIQDVRKCQTSAKKKRKTRKDQTFKNINNSSNVQNFLSFLFRLQSLSISSSSLDPNQNVD